MLNSVILMGRLTRDPNVRFTGEGKSVSNFSIAFTDFNGESTAYMDCVAFGKKSEFAEKYLHKGMKVVVQGRIDTGKYDQKDNNGNTTTRYFCRIIVSDIDFAEAKTNVSSEQKKTEELINVPEGVMEELPFN